MFLKPGLRVHYTAPHGAKQNGIVKEVRENICFVVFGCNDDWENYKNYTGQGCDIIRLSNGWVNANGDILQEYCDHHYTNRSFKWGNPNRMRCDYCGHIIND